MTEGRISIAIAALGGQGGGVLSNWIVDLAEENGYLAQSTAIAGVAQRTGTTIYSIELFPISLIEKEGKEPILALMPVAGDVDICIAAELMEAGRAVNRGIVTPDKTTLIASDHRIYAISEKEAVADGRLDSDQVQEQLKTAAKKLVLFDMDDAVLKSSSVISSVLFGALAGSGSLPFDKKFYEQTIQKSGRAVETNLVGFNLGFDNAKNKTGFDKSMSCGQLEVASSSPMLERINTFPEEARSIITYGVHRLVDYQDGNYATLYLDRLDGLDKSITPETLKEIARYLALWMGYEDVIRVADLKVRGERSEKISSEVRATEGQIWYAHDYFHPRYEEFIDIMPKSIGQMMNGSSFFKKILSPFFSKGRIIRPKTVLGHILLKIVASFRIIRKATLRYHVENKRILSWLSLVNECVEINPDLAYEVALCPRLIKGYGSTHERGVNRFSRIMAFIEKNQNQNNLNLKVAELRGAALLSSNGSEFNDSLKDYNEGEMVNNDAQKGEFAWAGSS